MDPNAIRPGDLIVNCERAHIVWLMNDAWPLWVEAQPPFLVISQRRTSWRDDQDLLVLTADGIIGTVGLRWMEKI